MMEQREKFSGKILFVYREKSQTLIGISDKREGERKLCLEKIDLKIERGKTIEGEYNPKNMKIDSNTYVLH